MSNPLAIATVTAALRQLLGQAADTAPGLSVTAKPPDRARVGEIGNQLNIFLYHLGPDAALRNAEFPEPSGAAEFRPPLSLTLEFMLTAFAADDDDVQAQKLLGRAMSIVHDKPYLDPALLASALPGTDLDAQPERVRVTPSTLPIDELSRLWTSLQTNFRLSTAFTASVVLIDSAIAVPTPLPVLRRASDDRGAIVSTGRAPLLARAYPDFGAAGAGLAAQLGDRLVIEGSELLPDDPIVLRRRYGDPLQLVPDAAGSSASRLLAALPDPAQAGVLAGWIAGPHAVSIVRSDEGAVHADGTSIALRSNEVGLGVAPAIAVAPQNAASGDIQLTVSCSPQLRAGQVASVLFGERELTHPAVGPTPPPDAPSTLTVTIPAVAPGTYVVRLRVDGVESRPLAGPAAGGTLPHTFDPAQQVTVA